MDWFLYDNELRHETVNESLSHCSLLSLKIPCHATILFMMFLEFHNVLVQVSFNGKWNIS